MSMTILRHDVLSTNYQHCRIAASWRLAIDAVSRVKPGFHYPSSRSEFTARQLGCSFDTISQLGPSTRVSKNAPEFTGRQLGLSTRAVNSGSGNRALNALYGEAALGTKSTACYNPASCHTLRVIYPLARSGDADSRMAHIK